MLLILLSLASFSPSLIARNSASTLVDYLLFAASPVMKFQLLSWITAPTPAIPFALEDAPSILSFEMNASMLRRI